MNELVYSKSSQATPDKKNEKSGAGKLLGSISIMGLVATAMTAITAMQQTDICNVFDKVKSIVKNPLLAAVLIGGFAYAEGTKEAEN